MASDRLTLVSPVGRIVAGSLYKGNDKNFDGQPLVGKDGKPRLKFFFALAIQKGNERAWWETSWGSQILAVGQRAFPQAYQRPDFAWKIEDGDSTIPNKRDRKPCDQEGYKGHWVLKFSSGYSVPIYMHDGSRFVQNLQEGFVKPGYYADVEFNVLGNEGSGNPGIYLNPARLCFRAYGQEIQFGTDANEVFGAATLPAGASLSPLASSAPMPSSGVHVPYAGASVANIPAHGVPAGGPPPPPGLAPIPIVPNPQFLQVPAPGAPAYPLPPGPGAIPNASGVQAPTTANAYLSSVAPPPAPAAPQGPRYQMAPHAVASREVYLAGNWTDAQLIQQGLMIQV